MKFLINETKKKVPLFTALNKQNEHVALIGYKIPGTDELYYVNVREILDIKFEEVYKVDSSNSDQYKHITYYKDIPITQALGCLYAMRCLDINKWFWANRGKKFQFHINHGDKFNTYHLNGRDREGNIYCLGYNEKPLRVCFCVMYFGAMKVKRKSTISY